jgi:hypothetical protein
MDDLNRKNISKRQGDLFRNENEFIDDQCEAAVIGIDETKRLKRSLNHIANFENGYAVDWYFAIPECFKSELDIKLTARKVPLIIDGKEQYEIVKTPKGNDKRQRLVVSLFTWTQGKEYCFAEGHTFYDTPKAYLQWDEALLHIKIACHILQATPSKLDENGKLVKGFVKCKLSKPDRSKKSLKTIGEHTMSQDEFVNFLKTGKLPK